MTPTMQIVTWLAVISGALGTLFPPAIALIQQEHWGNRTKITVTLVLCAGSSVVTVVGTGHWHGWNVASLEELAISWGAFFGGSQLTYRKLWIELLAIAPWLEHITTLKVIWGVIVAALPSTKRAQIQALQDEVAKLRAEATANTEGMVPVAEISVPPGPVNPPSVPGHQPVG